MPFTQSQLLALERRLPKGAIKTRVSDGKELSYIEGWYAVDRANRIFGFDCWDRETIDLQCVHVRHERSTTVAVYRARVRVSVRCGNKKVVRDGHGTGEARAASVGEAHDRALKGAETDATKRALATFGKAFGLALYSRKALASLTTPSADADTRPTARSDAPARPPEVHGQTAPPLDPRDMTTSGLRTLRAGIDKSALTFSEPKRLRDRDHLRHVAAQPCTLCGKSPCDAHHIGFAQPRALGRKVSDEFTVPLCRTHHAELHNEGNESAWWHDMGIDPLEIARQLWSESQNAGASNGTAR